LFYVQPQLQRSPIPNSLQQMSPLSLVTHASQQNPHHRLMGAPSIGQLPSIVPHDIEQRMLEYIKLFQAPKDLKRKFYEAIPLLLLANQYSQSCAGPQSPDVSREALNALEMSRMALWNMYNNTSPHNQHNNPSPPEVQQEALNLHQRESPSPIPSAPSPISIKRERDLHDMNEYPPAKRGLIRSNSDLNRKSSITNNNNNKYDHHIGNNNNSQVTPIKDNSSKNRSESPSITSQQMQSNENGTHHLQSPVRHHNKQNGLDSIGTTILNGMQFKIVSKGMYGYAGTIITNVI